MVIGHRQAYRHLAIVLLAKLPAILPRHADRVLALLGKAGVINDPVGNRAMPLDRRQHGTAHRSQHGRIIPRRLGHNVVHGLVLRLYRGRCDPCRHWFDALALAWQQQPGAIGPRRRFPTGMAQHRDNPIQIRCEPRLSRRRLRQPCCLICHTPYMGYELK
jgi:hypothetical protein